MIYLESKLLQMLIKTNLYEWLVQYYFNRQYFIFTNVIYSDFVHEIIYLNDYRP